MKRLRKASFYPEIYISANVFKVLGRISAQDSYRIKSLYKTKFDVIEIIKAGEKKPYKGPGEKFLFNKLKKSFKTIYNNRKLYFDDIKKTFYPDLLLELPEFVLLIEIDEPYDFKDGKPIHYYIELENRCYHIDFDWNKSLYDKGFNIIRFAEFQIFNDIDSCVDFINYVVNCLKNLKQPSLSFFQNRIPKLSEEEAIMYAYHHARSLYLPPDINAKFCPERNNIRNEFKRNLFK